ncbi:MAG: alpha/beta fold hydrolase [Burkholderiales bacterium]|nr:alpha/beta fold hydrolase [Burkholderiales bacterium]
MNGTIARSYLALLIALLALGAGSARLLAGSPVNPGVLLGAMLGAVLAPAAVAVALTYAISTGRATPPPPEFAIGRLALAAAMLRELAAHVIVFAVLVPFERVWMGRSVPLRASGDRDPVVLVHGYLCGAAAWWRFARLLEAGGFATRAVDVGPALGSIDDMADALARHVEEIVGAAGVQRVSLVAHSMGGLVCRAYLRRYGAARVGRLVTIGTPHDGTRVARLGIGTDARQMEPGSGWLAALAAHEAAATAARPQAVSIFSYHDNYIVPPASGALAWARHVPLAGFGHVETYFSTRVAALVAEALA